MRGGSGGGLSSFSGSKFNSTSPLRFTGTAGLSLGKTGHTTGNGGSTWRDPGKHGRKPGRKPFTAIVGIGTGGGGQGPIGPSNSGGSGNANQALRAAGSATAANHAANEVVIELAAGTTDQAADALAGRFRLTRLESFEFQLAGTKLYRWQIGDGRPVPAVVRALQGERQVLSASPNHILVLQGGPSSEMSGAAFEQYALAKLQLPQAHAIARGDQVLIAIIDGGVDASHPELAGVIADKFDAIGSGDQMHAHGTAVAGAIAAHARLTGSAPGALILAARAFGAERGKSDGTSFAVVKAMDWAVARGARVINMSFAGPRDPKIETAIKAARARGVVLVAAAGNAGAKSAPLYPAADPNVIAVTATDEADKLFHAANRGKQIGVAAPGVELWLPGLEGTCQEISGTSFAAAEVSGTVALLIERKPELNQEQVRDRKSVV